MRRTGDEGRRRGGGLLGQLSLRLLDPGVRENALTTRSAPLRERRELYHIYNLCPGSHVPDVVPCRRATVPSFFCNHGFSQLKNGMGVLDVSRRFCFLEAPRFSCRVEKIGFQ